MSNDPLDLWPASIEVEPLTPVAILQLQARRLKERTHGLLDAEIITTEEEAELHEGLENVHRFEIVAPGWNNYRHQLFRCHHDVVFVYPVWVTPGDPPEAAVSDWEKASSQDEFTQLIRKLLGSKDTVAVIQSLLARVAETRAGTRAAAS